MTVEPPATVRVSFPPVAEAFAFVQQNSKASVDWAAVEQLFDRAEYPAVVQVDDVPLGPGDELGDAARDLVVARVVRVVSRWLKPVVSLYERPRSTKKRASGAVSVVAVARRRRLLVRHQAAPAQARAQQQ